MEEKIGSKELRNYLKRVSSVHGMSLILSRTFRLGLYCGFVGNLISRVTKGEGMGRRE
jgi:hypothetical protein